MAKDGVEVFQKQFTATQVKNSLGTTDNYFHVYYPIIPDKPIPLSSGTYTFTISGVIYTEATFIGWIQQHEDIQSIMEYVPNDDSENPLTIRFKEYREAIV